MVKRVSDILISVAALTILLPVILLLLLLVLIWHGRPVFFSQWRPGKGGKPFEMLKFRTMTNDVDMHGNLWSDADRLTSFGRFLRSTSLDELPELWNVLKGDMSIVGPRPLLMEYLSMYTERQARRHTVRPGITGWAQVNGRNALSWEDRFELDVWYVDNQSFWLDIKIMWMTVVTVLKREGVSHAGHVTMEKYKGTNRE